MQLLDLDSLLMGENKSSYIQIFKTTSVFGGLQVFDILISIVRTKLIAIFIGPAGMGIISLLNATLGLITGFTGLGIETSAVKFISGNYKDNDLQSVAKIVSIVKKIVVVTGLLGTIITILLSSWLSTLTFGNSNFAYFFVYLSITLLFKQLSAGQLSIFQGLRKIRLLAKCNFYGNLFGFIFSLPLYYFYQIDAIIPTILIVSLSSLVVSFYFSRQIKIERSKSIEATEYIKEGKSILKLGVLLSFSGLLVLITTYMTQIFIQNNGGLELVGYYNAGFTLLNTYVGIIFTAMSTDYFPKLSSICNDNMKIRINVRQQSFVSIIIITPIIILFLTFIPIIIKVIYTPKFIYIASMVCFGILGMLFRAVSWSMGYIIIAKGDSKVFLKTGLFFNILSLFLNIVAYHFYGLEGLGVSFFVYYMIHFFVLKIITKKRYDFYFDRNFYQIYIICILMCLITFLFTYISNLILKYSLMSLMIMASLIFVFYQIKKEMGLKELFNGIIKKND